MSAFFLASNGLLYKNPLIHGDGYLIVFDGDEEPELILASDGIDSMTARLRAVQIIEQSGLAAMIDGPARRMLRPYDSDGVDTRDSYCFWLAVGEPIPSELLADSIGYSEGEADCEVVTFA